MAIKRTRKTTRSTKKKTARKRKSSRAAPALKEPPAARVMQAVLLAIAMLLLFSAMVSPRAGMIIVGVLVLVTAFPPIRGPVDEWLIGKRRGKDAEQAAAIRMAVGAGVVLFTLLGAFTSL